MNLWDRWLRGSVYASLEQGCGRATSGRFYFAFMAVIVMVRVNFDLKEDGKKLPKGGGKRRGTKSDYCCVVGMWPSPKKIGLELCSSKLWKTVSMIGYSRHMRGMFIECFISSFD
ncbi:hypothetical protein TNCV_3037501 [Trichonephila clavipes]|nr:hypothetical protein TNCV_3037501 [Trichonephila clavipes]